MKKLKLISLMLVLPVWLLSQVVINQDDMPNAGDTIRQSNTINLNGIDYASTGNNYTWDFTSLFPLTQTVDTFVSVSQTPFVYQLFFILSANLAQPGFEFNQFSGFQVTDSYSYYKKSSSDYRAVGFGVTLNGIPIPDKFQTDDIIYKFPLSTGNADSSNSVQEISIPGIGYLGGWKKRVNHVDGWGTLSTPFGTFNTLRVKSDIQEYDSIYLDSLNTGFPFVRNYTEYKWLANGFGIPLCTVTDDGLLPTISYIDSVRNLFVGVPETNLKNADIRIFPNPVNDELTLDLNLNKVSVISVYLYNTDGRVIAELMNRQQTSAHDPLVFNLGSYKMNRGLYALMISVDGKTFCKKFLKL